MPTATKSVQGNPIQVEYKQVNLDIRKAPENTHMLNQLAQDGWAIDHVVLDPSYTKQIIAFMIRYGEK